ncbi:MAG TPA: hypothetical protein VD947_02820 [Patescibacteria group bacterium]|nr:hypothetical protein [Patescibacteria group bacterium]
MSEALKNMNALTATAAVTATLAAAEAPALAHDQPVDEGQTQSEAEFEQAMQEYCEDLVFGKNIGKILRLDAEVEGYRKGGYMHIEGSTTDADDPDCSGRAERESVILDVVEILKNGKIRDISPDIKIEGENSQTFDRALNLRNFREGDDKSRKIAVRRRVQGIVEGDMVVMKTTRGRHMVQRRR